MSKLAELIHQISSHPDHAGINNMVRGLEKESLRITPEGTLATTPHPASLGSALTHPHITTDYSEALLEFITDPHPTSAESIEQLNQLHAFTYQNLDNEQLWVTSMPCMLGADSDIPIAQYGSSNSGLMKTVYREGLGHRYGRTMQTIAGIHYNFSVPDSLWEFLQKAEKSPRSLQDFKTQGYFRLIRNFRRYFWLLLYLFGASPGVCKSFVGDKKHQLVPFGDDVHSLHTPYATSLRMGDLGYQSNAQDSLVITYNCLDSYISTLCCAIKRTHPDYAKTGIKDKQGNYQQLNDGLLQIENEFYSVIRPKRTAERGETALSALSERGIEYIEVRCLDINPYEPAGISEQQSHFLDTFLIYCLLSDSPASDEAEYTEIQENQKRMVYSGRDPELTLLHQGKERSMRDWGKQLMDGLSTVAQFLDRCCTEKTYQKSVAIEKQKLDDASLTPSARILADMAKDQVTFYRFAANKSLEHKDFFINYPLDAATQPLTSLAKDSIRKQMQLENSQSIPFDQYLADYYAQYDCCASESKTPSTATG